MASALGMGRRAAKRAVRELRARGLIRPINGERGAYLIAPRSKWRAILARRGGLSQW
jgi:biotin operon repressor